METEDTNQGINSYPSRKSLYGFEYRDKDQRRVPERSAPDIKELWQRNHEIVNLAAKGFKNTEIAEILSITPQTVSNTLNSELGMKKLSKIRYGRDEEAKKAAEKIRVLTNKAIDTYNKIFDNELGDFSNEQQRKTADNVMLELSGLKAPTRIDTRGVLTVATLEEIEEFKKRGMQAVNDSKMVVVQDEPAAPEHVATEAVPGS